MLLRERFNAAMKEAMKSGDKPRLSAVRLINSAVKDRDIEARGAGKGEATEDERDAAAKDDQAAAGIRPPSMKRALAPSSPRKSEPRSR